MTDVYIDLGDRSYHIFIGTGLLKQLGQHLARLKVGKNPLLVTNPTVGSLYAPIAEKSLAAEGFRTVKAEIPDGEEYKSLATAEELYDLAYTRELDRQCPVVALGGGVVGDLAGFVASTYLRGVPFIQVPTTLLAQVDSSVGGKVAVNHPRGKNIIGAFYQPRLVLADLDVLKSLDSREIRAGLAEVIKYGVISDTEFFAWLEDNLDSVLSLEPDSLSHVVAKSCKIKAEVVQADETEQGRRAILNFGHTVGHAIEALTQYKVYRHGEAVAIGMMAAARLAMEMGFWGQADVKRLKDLLVRTGLPTRVPEGLSRKEIIMSMYRDKKVLSGRLTFVLPTTIGQVDIIRDTAKELVIKVLD